MFDGWKFLAGLGMFLFGMFTMDISKGTIREHEVTRLLMTNRFFTQSIRMIVLSMQALTRAFSFPEDRVHSPNHDNL